MNSPFKLSIDKPCHEKFESFDSTEAGGFCQACQKEVTDFSKLSDSEVSDYFKENRGKKVCGRFRKNQLKEYLQPNSPCNQPSLAFGAGAMSLSLISLLPITGSAQSDHTPLQAHQQQNREHESISSKTVKSDTLATGTVTDGKEVIPFVYVMLKSTGIGTSTDIDGKFQFPKPLVKGDTLIFSFLGYETKEHVITANSEKNITIELEEAELVLMGEVSIKEAYSSKKSFWQKLNAFFK